MIDQLTRLTDSAAHAYTNARRLVFDETSNLDVAALNLCQRLALSELDRAEGELNRFRMVGYSRGGA